MKENEQESDERRKNGEAQCRSVAIVSTLQIVRQFYVTTYLLRTTCHPVEKPNNARARFASIKVFNNRRTSIIRPIPAQGYSVPFYCIIQSGALILIGLRKYSLNDLATVRRESEIDNDGTLVPMYATVGLTHLGDGGIEYERILFFKDLENGFDGNIVGPIHAHICDERKGGSMRDINVTVFNDWSNLLGLH